MAIGATIEKIFYESRPYIYGALSVVAFMNGQVSKVMFVSGVVLAICSMTVFRARYVYRNPRKRA